jgi:hypothetical protein
MSAITILQAVLPVVSQVVYVVLLFFSIYLAWLKIREYHRRDQDE